MRQKEDKALQRLLAAVRQDPHILALLRFGSAARGQQVSRSDLDICLILAPETKPYDPQRLAEKRLEYLNCNCDLDLHIFQQLPLYIRESFKHIYHDYLEQVADAGS